MSIDQPRHDDHARGVDPPCIGGVEMMTNRGDPAVLDQQIAAIEDAQVRINGDDHTVRDQCSFHGASTP